MEKKGMEITLSTLNKYIWGVIKPLNAELNPIRHLLALVEARHIVHVSRIWVKNKVKTQCLKFIASKFYIVINWKIFK